MNVAILLQRAGRVHAERPAICLGTSVQASYAAMARRAATLAGWLRESAGLAPGDRVALAMANCPAYLEVLYAIWHAGLAAVPINAKLHRDEFAYILDHSGARLCFVTADLAETIVPLADTLDGLDRVLCVDDKAYARGFAGDPIAVADRAPEDLAWLFYTSGTTGRPKGAMLSHRVLLAMTLCYLSDVDTVAPEDCILHAAPLSHGSGCYNPPHVLRGARQVLPESGRFDPAEIFDLLPRQPGTAMFAAPTMVKRLITHPAAATADTRNLKTIVYGGGPMYVADCMAAMALLGNKLVQIYGQGESPMTITVLDRAQHADSDHPRYEERLASVGVAQSVVEMRVADANDRTLPPGEVGEVLARGDVVMTGYWRNPEATAETLRGGWLHTGDMGAVDVDGFLTLKDRSKDMIISGGSNIYPREVEELLLRHDGVAEVSVIGRPDPDWGEVVVAFVVPAPGAVPTAEALDALCLQAIARFKRPKQYRFVDALPKNNYGKVLKTTLREQLAAEDEA